MQFKEPSDTGALPTKSADLLRLLSEGQNVVLSHELFKLLNDTAIDRIKEFDYTLFLDEEIEVVELSDITQDDLKILKEQHLIEIDPTSKRVKWLDSQYHGDFDRDFTLSPKNLLSHKYIQKTETISDLRFSAPLGARTLDPNIKSVVLYQLS